MARIIANVSIFVAVAVVAAASAHEAPAADVLNAPGVVRGMAFYGDGCCHDPCDHHCCCCHVPEVTVHVIQPPPTYIYDLTQTACYTEHHDCCGCPYVCGPTCIPQGEVLAPHHPGKRVVVADNGVHNVFADVELKFDPRERNEALRQVIDYARQFHTNQHDRWFAWGLTVCLAEVRECVLLHDAVLESPAMDFAQPAGRRQLVRLLVDLSVCNAAQLGYDPTIRRIKGSKHFNIDKSG
ncbi:hypothetical protein H4R18_000807 [Coemansia javaensis]|uniref:Fungal-type protein kinase domain-containing protein n=1 Tax=Coemansia javaensis TaxID=2761396 RepID=A0A9W8HH08_9FUNG|nr:hypothetical protein H4R18_000807 [Coemansia javaensis]